MSAVVEAREPSARYLEAMQPALVRQFGLLATAPGGVARLRELILTLAVQGKLVRQDPSDEPADRLLTRVHAAKRELVASGRISRDKPVEPVTDDDAGFPLPAGWAWCRLGDLTWPQAGFAFKSAGFNEVGQGLPLIRIRDVGSGAAPTTFFSGEHRAEFLVENGEWLISMDGEFRVRQWHATTALLNQRVTRLVFASGKVHKDFVATALQRELTSLQGTKAYTTVDHLSGKQIAEAVIALPPSAEQARIVARVDELMRLCDALEAQGRLEAEQHAGLLCTLLRTLIDSSAPEELAAHWQRVAARFDLLLDRPEAVDALEQTILQLAVRGLLVPQDPKDEPSDHFLQGLRDERLRALPKQKGNRDELRSTIENGLYALRSGWTWTTIEAIADVGTGTTPSRDNAAFFTGGTIPWVTSGETGQAFIRKTEQYVTEAALAKTSLTVYPVGTLIVAMYGQGKTRGQVSELCLEATTNQACAAIVLIERLAAHRAFIKLVFEKSYEEIRELSAGGAQPNLNVGKVKASLIPLPPLAQVCQLSAQFARPSAVDPHGCSLSVSRRNVVP